MINTIFIYHMIGAIMTLIIFYENGIFKEAAERGDGIRFARPSDVIFYAVVLWEFLFLIYLITLIEEVINNRNW